MLNDNVKLITPEKKEYPVLPARVYQVEILSADMVKKIPYNAQPGAGEEDFIAFKFGILSKGDYRGRMLFKDARPMKPFPPSGKGKASLIYEIGVAVRGGTPFTKEEAEAFEAKDINAWIGKQILLTVNQKPNSKGDLVNGITGYSPIEAPLDPLSADNQRPDSKEAPLDPFSSANQQFSNSIPT